jgi:hypothetical protein
LINSVPKFGTFTKTSQTNIEKKKDNLCNLPNRKEKRAECSAEVIVQSMRVNMKQLSRVGTNQHGTEV